MEHEVYTERNHGQGLRITEIPPIGDYETAKCPFCDGKLTVSFGVKGKCNEVVTYCKKCKRTLEINGTRKQS